MLQRELAEAERLARAAGTIVLSFYGNVRVQEKAAGSPVTEADHAANRLIVAELHTLFPQDGVLSEESRDSPERLSRERVWIVDPLDGTREFIAGIGEFAVMIGLAVNGRAQLGVVYTPADDTLYAGVIGAGAWIERRGQRSALRAAPAGPGAPRLVGSRSHPDPLLAEMEHALGITDVRPSGSVGVKCALVALGVCDLYIHPVPYLKEWDTCAPEVVLRAAGGFVTDCLGEPLCYNKPDPLQPTGIIALAPGTSPAVADTVARFWRARPADVARSIS